MMTILNTKTSKSVSSYRQPSQI